MAHEKAIANPAQGKQDRSHNKNGQIGIDAGQGEEPERRVHGQHQVFTMGEVYDLHHPENQGQANGGECVDTA